MVTLLLECHSVPGVPYFPENNEEDGVPYDHVDLWWQTAAPKIRDTLIGGKFKPLPDALSKRTVDKDVRVVFAIEPASWT